METSNFFVSTCRRCQFYQLEGRRGGQCQQLGALVQGGWKACSLAIPPFAPSWENLDDAVTWRKETVGIQDAFATGSPHSPSKQAVEKPIECLESVTVVYTGKI